jgi:hypothetical protein
MTYARGVLLSRLPAATGSALAALAVATAPAVTAVSAVSAAAAAQASTTAAARPGAPAASIGAPSTPGQQIAAALRASPLYVDPSLSAVFPPGVRSSLLHQISRAPVPVFILAVPLPSGGEWANGGQLATVVHDYLGRDGIYLTIDAEFSYQIDAYTFPSDPAGTGAAPYNAADAAMAANLARATRDGGLAQKFLRCVELIADGQSVPAYQAALRQAGAPQVAPHRRTATGQGHVLLIVLIVLTAVAAALAAATAARRLLRRRQPRQSPALLPEGGPSEPPPAWPPQSQPSSAWLAGEDQAQRSSGEDRARPSSAWPRPGDWLQPLSAWLLGAVASARAAASSEPAHRLLTRVRTTVERITRRDDSRPR